MAGLAAALGGAGDDVSATSIGGVARGAFLSALAIGLRVAGGMADDAVARCSPWCADRGLSVATAAMAAGAAFVAGALVWLIPLAWLTGGPSSYWQVLSNQGAEDLSGVVTLWTTPTLRQVLSGLRSAFVAPWGPPALASAVLLLAVAGVAAAGLALAELALTTLAVAFVPYLRLRHVVSGDSDDAICAAPRGADGVPGGSRRGILDRCGSPPRLRPSLSSWASALRRRCLLRRLCTRTHAIEAPAFRMLADMRKTARRRQAAGAGDASTPDILDCGGRSSGLARRCRPFRCSFRRRPSTSGSSW